MERPSLWTAGGEFSSDPRKSITFGLGFGGGKDAYGGWNFATGGSVGIKTSTRWNLTLSPGIEKAYTLAQYVGTVPDPSATHTYGAHYLFAPLNQTTVALETRLDFTFNPRLSVQLFAQPAMIAPTRLFHPIQMGLKVLARLPGRAIEDRKSVV